MRRIWMAVFVSFPALGFACSDPVYSATPRDPSVRAPRTAACDDLDETRCLLPFPSNRYARKDATSATGIRLALNISGVGPANDDPSFINRADGFSRVQPVMFGFRGTATAVADGDAFLVAADPNKPSYGTRIRVEVELFKNDIDTPETLLTLYPQAVLEAATDHVAVVLDGVTFDGGARPDKPRQVLVALGLAKPSSQDEAELFAYHAPTRQLLTKMQVPLSRVARLTDFTTRSAQNPLGRVIATRAAVQAATKARTIKTVIDSVDTNGVAPIAMAVLGHFEGVPKFLNDDGTLKLDEHDMPVQTGVQNAPFRVMVPQGIGTYRVILFGHGTGGNVRDRNFDPNLAGLDLGKANYEFQGWTDETLFGTILGMRRAFKGVEASTGGLTQGLANGAALDESLSHELGDLLAADTILGQPNPAKGRRPDMSQKVWGGGSMGGSMGFVIAGADPDIRFAALNVPGAVWTHFIPRSAFYAPVKDFIRSSYGGALDARHAILMTQTEWDDIDGSVWADAGPKDLGGDPVYLIQESINDPVIGNNATAMVARASNATLVGPVINDIPGLPRADSVEGKSGLTQYKVPNTSDSDVHGFGDCKNAGGDAAREQIVEFFGSVWSGKPRISTPKGCTSNNSSCDFTGQWSGDCVRLGGD